MPDPNVTLVQDIIVPEVFNPYVREAVTRTNAFFSSGVIQTVPELQFAATGGSVINMPFWKQLGERAQLLDDKQDLVVKKIQSGKDKAVQQMRALVYGASDLAAALAGSDPMRAIGDGLAENWSHELNLVAFASLTGAMGALAAESPDVNVYNISGLSGNAAIIDGASFIDANQMLGDKKVQIVAVAMHSAVEARLAKNDLIIYTTDSSGKIALRTFMGKTVIIDDDIPLISPGVYQSFLFGAGALGYAEGNPKVPTEVERRALINGGEEYVVSRRHFVMHPRGIAWDPNTGVPALETPSDAELQAPGNWARVYQGKNIRIIRFIHKI